MGSINFARLHMALVLFLDFWVVNVAFISFRTVA